MITKRFTTDFTNLPSNTFKVTLTAPNGDAVEYQGLSGEQTEQMWRLWQAVAGEWEFTWQGTETTS